MQVGDCQDYTDVLTKTNFLGMTTRWHSDCSVLVSEGGPSQEREQSVLTRQITQGKSKRIFKFKVCSQFLIIHKVIK